jgi:polysaccharide deacetylase family protein (PEP-CTERM system associated)
MTCLLSFDVEDWFHAHNLRPAVDREDWDECEARVVPNTRRILSLLDKHGVKATFFVLAWVAERHPSLIQKIDDQGHEIASHGYNHRLLYQQTPREIRDDLERSIEVLGSIVDQPVQGYRAPSFSITDGAVDILADLGFQYDSSSFAVQAHDRYGKLTHTTADELATFTRLGNTLTEARLPQLRLPVGQVPWAGGGYFRVMPYSLYRMGVRRIAEKRPFIFYLHPWDLDADQPRRDIPLSYRLRHYTNLDKTASKLDRLLGDFDWQPIGEYLAEVDGED